MDKKLLILMGVLLVCSILFASAIAGLGTYVYVERDKAGQINSFTECEVAGYLVVESYSRQCAVPGGKHLRRA